MMWMRMPGQSWAGAAAAFVGAWTIMMIAMMLPSLVPALSRYRRATLEAGGAHPGLGTVVAGAGYFFVWSLVGAASYPVGAALASAAMRSQDLARGIPVASGVLLLAAGIFQMTGWKARQLGTCRTMADTGSPWRFGVRFGARCVLCCAGLVTLLFVLGAMSLGAILVVGAAITLERIAPRPDLVARVSGALIVAMGALVIARAITAA